FTCTATNAAGLTASRATTVRMDQTPPSITGMPIGPCLIWPPNKKLVQIADVNATDTGSGVAGPAQFTVTSNEPVNPGDIVITGNVVQVVADRLGNGNDRVYRVQSWMEDLAGNYTMAFGTCMVPHDVNIGITTFDPPGSIKTEPSSINKAGADTGTYYTRASVYAPDYPNGFIRDAQGTFTSFDVPTAYFMEIRSIKDAATVTGDYAAPDAAARYHHGFIRDAQGTITTFDVGDATLSAAINNAGEVTG